MGGVTTPSVGLIEKVKILDRVANNIEIRAKKRWLLGRGDMYVRELRQCVMKRGGSAFPSAKNEQVRSH